MQQGHKWHFGKIEFSADLENASKYTQFNVKFKSGI